MSEKKVISRFTVQDPSTYAKHFASKEVQFPATSKEFHIPNKERSRNQSKDSAVIKKDNDTIVR